MNAKQLQANLSFVLEIQILSRSFETLVSMAAAKQRESTFVLTRESVSPFFVFVASALASSSPSFNEACDSLHVITQIALSYCESILGCNR